MHKNAILTTEQKIQRHMHGNHVICLKKAFSSIFGDAKTCLAIPDTDKGEIRLVPVFQGE